MSLGTRFGFAVGLAVALAVALAAVSAHAVTERALDRELDEFLIDRAEKTAWGVAALDRSDGRRNRSRSVLADALATPDAIVQIVDRQGQILIGTQGVAELPVGGGELELLGKQQARPVFRTVEIDSVEFRMVTVPTIQGAVQVARSRTETSAALGRIDRRLFMLGMFGSAIAGLAGWLVAQRIVAPVVALTAKAERVAATQDLSEPIDVQRNDELGRLGSAFNQMLQALDLSRRQQQRLIQDAGHELRTPLTSIRTNIDVLARRHESLEPDMRRQILSDIAAEVDEMTDLVADVVVHSSGQADQAQPIDGSLADIATDVASRYERRSGRSVGVEIDPSADGVTTKIRPDQIDRAISNLVANSIKFTPNEGLITLVVSATMVECQDTGPGVPPEDLDRIFDRFYRPVSSRTEPGSGLGLAIVKQVALNHNGRVWAHNRAGGGASIGFGIGDGLNGPRS